MYKTQQSIADTVATPLSLLGMTLSVTAAEETKVHVWSKGPTRKPIYWALQQPQGGNHDNHFGSTPAQILVDLGLGYWTVIWVALAPQTPTMTISVNIKPHYEPKDGLDYAGDEIWFKRATCLYFDSWDLKLYVSNQP